MQFLAHPQPLMFVAGLAAAGPSDASRDRSGSNASSGLNSGPSSRRPSASAGTLLDPSSLTGGALPFASPRHDATPALPSSPPAVQSPPIEELQLPPLGSISPSDQRTPTRDQQLRDEEFDKLITDLRGGLTGLGGKGKMWLPYDRRKEFRIILVDKNHRMPARKARDTLPDQPARSTLSPLTPSSPVYPDGLIAPIWVRKHAEMVPSVFVLFLRLYELREAADDLSNADKEAFLAEELDRQKSADESLVKEIGDRRKKLGERGIKLTVVLMASGTALDSPSLDPRLSYVRRASALSSRASLFVLSPVPPEQLSEFVASLQETLHDSAMEYYANHIKKIRRKRARLPTGQAAQVNVPPGHIRTIGPHGWAARYDWKAAWFAEIRGELDVAKRYYEDCWNELSFMFASTTMLPPRTKRWAEAKVLADCVAIRICRLCLYGGDGPKVLVPFHVHLKRFGDMSRGWGIGEETFEYWSWLARQYRIFAELLELATSHGLAISGGSFPLFPAAGSIAHPPPPDYYSTPTSSLNPTQILQQPAHYFYAAACCSLERRKRFEQALDAEAKASEGQSPAPGFVNEKTVDHSALIVELFGKAYALSKEHQPPQTRVALHVAYRIADMYMAAQQYEKAMRYFETIAQSFTSDGFEPLVCQIRLLWFQCAQQTGEVEIAARLLLEMLSPESGLPAEQRVSLQEDFLGLLKTTTPSSSTPLSVTLGANSNFLDVRGAFWSDERDLFQPAPYQVVISCPENVDISALSFDSLSIAFSDGNPDVVIKGADESEASESANRLDAGVRDTDPAPLKTVLRWTPGRVFVIEGSIVGRQESTVNITAIKLHFEHASWKFEISIYVRLLPQWSSQTGLISPIQELAPAVSFTPAVHGIRLEVQNAAVGYVNEDIPINLVVHNDEDLRLACKLSVLLQPVSGETDASHITVDGQESSSLLREIDLGRLDGSSLSRVIYLKSSIASIRIMEVSLHTTTASPDTEVQHTEETQCTITLPILHPFFASSTVKIGEASGLAGERYATVTTTLTAPGPRPLTVDKLRLVPTDNHEIELVSNSLPDEDGEFATQWNQQHAFSLCSRFLVRPRRPSVVVGAVPAEVEITWRTGASASPVQTLLPLPPLSLPRFEPITASLSAPSSTSLSATLQIQLSLRNATPKEAFINLVIETSENFVWTGGRNVHVTLPGGGQKDIPLRLTTVAGVGWVSVPAVRAFEEGLGGRTEMPVTWAKGDGKVFVRP